MVSSPLSSDDRSNCLDRERLDCLYGDDTETFQSTIEMFLEEVTPVFLELPTQIESQNWETFTLLTHQLRPLLGLVGLTTLEKELLAMEEKAKTEPDTEFLRNSYHHFNAGLERMIPLLNAELQRLE
ncbi:Hpt domain-containing protein [Larkinella bovis]|uniref:Hpt domain-containing protein n=1 Tax=Larkinella bovis TaxID=683041 RepID=A0ABW0IHU2_9BACT